MDNGVVEAGQPQCGGCFETVDMNVCHWSKNECVPLCVVFGCLLLCVFQNCFNEFDFADLTLSCVSSKQFGSFSFATMCGLVVPIALAHAGCILALSLRLRKHLRGAASPLEPAIESGPPRERTNQVPLVSAHAHRA